MDYISVVNFVLCLAIVAIGYWSYSKSRAIVVLYAALAFALFGLSHLITFLGMGGGAGLLVIQTMGYLFVLYGFYASMGAKSAALGAKAKR